MKATTPKITKKFELAVQKKVEGVKMPFTFEPSNSDERDFFTISKWELHSLMITAYKMGEIYGKKEMKKEFIDNN